MKIMFLNTNRFFFNIFITCTFCFLSCNNQEETLTKSIKRSEAPRLSYESFENLSPEELGALHNQGVTFILDQLDADGFKVFSLPVENMNELIKNTAINFFIESEIATEEEMESIVNDLIPFRNELFTGLSAETYSYLMSMNNILSLDEELSQTQNKLLDLRSDIEGTFSNEEEEFLMLSSIEIGLNSINLWEEDYLTNLISVFKDDQAIYEETIASFDRRAIVNSDVRGGWQAGLGYIWLNAGGMVGWGAFCGCILVGAVISSATDYFDQFIFRTLDSIEADYPFMDTENNYYLFLQELYSKDPGHSYFQQENGKYAEYINLF